MAGTAIEQLASAVAAGFELNAIKHAGRDYSVMVVPAAMVTFVTAVIIFSQVITKNNEFCRLWSWLGCFSSQRLLLNL